MHEPILPAKGGTAVRNPWPGMEVGWGDVRVLAWPSAGDSRSAVGWNYTVKTSILY